MGAYTELARLPGARMLMTAATTVRLGHGIILLGLLLAINNTQTTAWAGLSVAVYVLANSFSAPLIARGFERYGMPRILMGLSLISLIAHGVLAMSLNSSPLAVLLLATICGIAWPGSSSMPIWQAIAPPERLPTAAAVEGILSSTAYTVGPLIASVLALVDFKLAIIVPALLGAIGATVLACASATRIADAHHRRGERGDIPPVGWLLALMTFGMFLSLDALIVLSATSSGAAYAGIMSALLIGASALSSFFVGRASHPTSNRRLTAYALLLFACGLAVCAWAYFDAPLWSLAVVLIVFGSARAPINIANATKIAQACPIAPYRVYALQSIAIATGAAAGNAAAGVLGSAAGIAIVGGAFMTVVACVLVARLMKSHVVDDAQ